MNNNLRRNPFSTHYSIHSLVDPITIALDHIFISGMKVQAQDFGLWCNAKILEVKAKRCFLLYECYSSEFGNFLLKWLICKPMTERKLVRDNMQSSCKNISKLLRLGKNTYVHGDWDKLQGAVFCNNPFKLKRKTNNSPPPQEIICISSYIHVPHPYATRFHHIRLKKIINLPQLSSHGSRILQIQFPPAPSSSSTVQYNILIPCSGRESLKKHVDEIHSMLQNLFERFRIFTKNFRQATRHHRLHMYR